MPAPGHPASSGHTRLTPEAQPINPRQSPLSGSQPGGLFTPGWTAGRRSVARLAGRAGLRGRVGARWLLAGRGGGLAEPSGPASRAPGQGTLGGFGLFLVFFFFLATSKIPCRSGVVQMYFQEVDRFSRVGESRRCRHRILNSRQWPPNPLKEFLPLRTLLYFLRSHLNFSSQV